MNIVQFVHILTDLFFSGMKFKVILIMTLGLVMLVSCQAPPSRQSDIGLLDWKYADLRSLDPSDADRPDQDMIAFYTRINGAAFQLRIDFLDLGAAAGKDIHVFIDTNPGGSKQIGTKDKNQLPVDISWDYMIKLSASGNVEFIDDHLSAVNGAALFIVRDRALGSLILNFNQNTLPLNLGKTQLQVIVTSPDQNLIIDKSASFSIDAPSPARGRVLLAFWNTFRAVTPAQTLRSWDGAHTGPMRTSHGLRYLLEAAEQTNTTLFLLDQMELDTLSALDYIGVLPKIEQMKAQGTLVLSRSGNLSKISSPGQSSLVKISDTLHSNLVKTNGNDSDLDTFSQYKINGIICFMMSRNFDIDSGIDIGGNDYTHYTNCDLSPVFEISDYSQLAFSIDCKKLLLASTLRQSNVPLLLGGDFSKSIFGNPGVSFEIFDYIKTHPWLQATTLTDLPFFPNTQICSPPPYLDDRSTLGSQTLNEGATTFLTEIQSEVYEALQNSPDNKITDLAWQVYERLVSASSSNRVRISSNYIGSIREFVSAAIWAENPTPISNCSDDLDFDGTNECILANSYIFAIIEPDGGFIPFMFAIDDQDVHQIIGPTWEFIIGLSDPSTWDPSVGLRSDPDQILGAFTDQFNYWNKYTVNLAGKVISIENSDMSIRKVFTIFPDYIHIDILSSAPELITASIPLVLDPWIRFTSGWGDLYSSHQTSTNFRWGIRSGINVEIYSTNKIDSYPFNESRSVMVFPEDPNYAYPLGHYLPYPMALVEISPSDTYSVDIRINP